MKRGGRKSLKDDKTLVRLMRILSRLNDGEELSTKGLAEDFGVSIRTIQKDFSERLDNNHNPFPIEYDTKKRIWKLKENHKITDGLTINEHIALYSMLEFSKSIGGKFFDISKGLISRIKEDRFSSIYTKLDMEDISDILDLIYLFDELIRDRLKVVFDYKEKRRTLEPIKIVSFEGFWYLLAKDCKDEIVKKYYLKDIKNIEKSKDRFVLDEKLKNLIENSVNAWFRQDVKPFNVKLKLSKEVAKYFIRRPISKTQKIIESFEDKSITISLKITNELEITPTVKKYIPFIEILEPSWLRDIMVEDLNIYLEKFK